jgi:hypothetical protein
LKINKAGPLGLAAKEVMTKDLRWINDAGNTDSAPASISATVMTN